VTGAQATQTRSKNRLNTDLTDCLDSTRRTSAAAMRDPDTADAKLAARAIPVVHRRAAGRSAEAKPTN